MTDKPRLLSAETDVNLLIKFTATDYVSHLLLSTPSLGESSGRQGQYAAF